MKVSAEKLKTWKEMSVRLKKLKEDEMTLRKEIVKDITGGTTKRVMTKANVDGIKVKAVFEVAPKIDDKESLLDDRDGMSPELQACFPLDVKLSISKYKALSDEDKDIANAYIVEYINVPTLEVTIPVA